VFSVSSNAYSIEGNTQTEYLLKAGEVVHHSIPLHEVGGGREEGKEGRKEGGKEGGGRREGRKKGRNEAGKGAKVFTSVVLCVASSFPLPSAYLSPSFSLSLTSPLPSNHLFSFSSV